MANNRPFKYKEVSNVITPKLDGHIVAFSIALIGDCKQNTPFKFDTADSVLHLKGKRFFVPLNVAVGYSIENLRRFLHEQVDIALGVVNLKDRITTQEKQQEQTDGQQETKQ